VSEALDGNAAAGTLAAVFGIEMTVATGVCGSCGAAGEVGTLRAYVRGPGIVLRCRSCDGVLIRVVEAPGRTWLDLSGLRTLELRY
jgi:uncharacterized protein DUF6510